jgi:hypothetical protein
MSLSIGVLSPCGMLTIASRVKVEVVAPIFVSMLVSRASSFWSSGYLAPPAVAWARPAPGSARSEQRVVARCALVWVSACLPLRQFVEVASDRSSSWGWVLLERRELVKLAVGARQVQSEFAVPVVAAALPTVVRLRYCQLRAPETSHQSRGAYEL